MNYECAAIGLLVFMFAAFIGVVLGVKRGNNTKE